VLFEIKEIDQQVYEERLVDFLPTQIIDFHTHVWLKEFRTEMPAGASAQTWPRRVAEDNSIEDLMLTYDLLLPKQKVTPVIFGWPERDANLDKTNEYVSKVAREKGLASFLVTRPDWSAAHLENRVIGGGFIGLKPYLNWSPLHIPTNEITVFDFLPHEHLEVADAHGWIVLLHIPRKDRLKDPLNLKHMLEIEKNYPNLKLVIAHLGRAYCCEDVGNALEILQQTERMLFDISANTNAWVFEQALRTFGPQRLVFGSDLPILRMRMRRICENGLYINLVPPGLYGDISGDSHMREVSLEEGEKLSFFLYEELYAFRCAAEAVGLSNADVQAVFYENAAQMISAAQG
jgi:uncharacterized protein